MSLLRNAIRSRFSLRCGNTPNGAFSSSLLRESPRSFSTEAEHPPQAPAAAEKPAQNSATASSFPQTSPGLVYGRIFNGISSSTLKTDILSLLGVCKLTPEDVRVDYNLLYYPVGMVIQFSSRRAYDQAMAIMNRSGRLYRLERADRRVWDVLKPFDGKTLCIKGLPQNASQDDLDRFLSGCDYNASSTQIFYRNMPPRSSTRIALVPFPSQVQAMNAFVKKNGGFIRNSQVSVQVLQ